MHLARGARTSVDREHAHEGAVARGGREPREECAVESRPDRLVRAFRQRQLEPDRARVRGGDAGERETERCVPERGRFRNRRHRGRIDADDDDVVGRGARRELAQHAPLGIEQRLVEARAERREDGDESRDRESRDRDRLGRRAAAVVFPHGVYLNARARRC